MFRVRRVGNSPAVFWITFALLGSIVAATGVTIWLVAEVRKEQQALDEIVRRGSIDDVRRLGTLPGELRWQFVLTVLVLGVLVVAAAALVFLVRAYLKSQQSLRDVQKLALDILSSMDQGVLTVDRDGCVSTANLRAEQMLQLGADCVGQPIWQLTDDDAGLDRLSNSVLTAQRPVYDHTFRVSAKGHELQLRADCHLLKDEDARVLGTVVHLRDVTERALMEDRMRRMERFMGLGTLAAGLHHEIKNPLGALALHVQLLEERLAGQTDRETAETLGVLKTEVTRISGVLESFRDYAATERLNLHETDVCRIARQMVDLIRPQTNKHNIELVLELQDTPVPKISADAARLEQVLLNLVMNALEEMQDGGRLSVAVRSDDDNVIVAVSDTGRGIPDHILPRIFDPYFTTKSEGSGMGLAVCDKIIRQHGGAIDCQTGSAGTVFHVSLPRNK